MLFDKIVENYKKYIGLDYDKQLHAGELLAQSARLLLKIRKKDLSNKDALQKNYLMHRIARDLARQAQNMGHTKQYDCVPALKEYNYLAYDLMMDYWNSEPNRELIPYLYQVIYYERQNPTDDKDLKELENLYQKCLALEEKYLQIFLKAGTEHNHQ